MKSMKEVKVSLHTEIVLFNSWTNKSAVIFINLFMANSKTDALTSNWAPLEAHYKKKGKKEKEKIQSKLIIYSYERRRETPSLINISRPEQNSSTQITNRHNESFTKWKTSQKQRKQKQKTASKAKLWFMMFTTSCSWEYMSLPFMCYCCSLQLQ